MSVKPSGCCGLRRYWPAVPIALALGAGALVGVLLLGLSGPQAQAADLAPSASAGFQTTEHLILTVSLPGAKKHTRGTLAVELLGPGGKALARQERKAEAGESASAHRFEFDLPKLPPDKIIVRCSFGKEPVEVPLAKILLVKAHETVLSASVEMFAGSRAALRCQVQGVKSLTETVPLPGSAVTVRLRGNAGKVYPLFSGKAGPDGVAAVRFRVPDVPAGSYKMEVLTKSTLGEEKLERDVKVKSAPKVLLTTDKPLYQPGQVIRLRALALKAFDLTPAAKATLTLEVEDPKGNKVYKRELTSSDFGIASADFQLADEVNQGEYRVRATLGEHQAEKTVTVKPYVLPKFKAELKADKRYYLPKETLKGDLQVDYFFGKPVARGKVKVTASTFDVAFKEFQTWEGETDDRGHATFRIKLPDSFVGLPLAKGDALVRLEVKVTDTADHSETVSKTYPVSAQPIKVSLLPEGGRLVPGLENRVFAAALYPDGSPAKCTVQVWAGKKAEGKPLATVKTSDSGLAEVSLTPKPGQFRQGAWQQRQVEALGGTQVVWGPTNLFDLTAKADDGKGNSAVSSAELSGEPLGENVLLRLDKAVYKGGDSIHLDVRTSAGLPTVYLDVVKSGQTMLTRWLDVKGGKASHELDLPAGVFGTLEVHAYQMLASGEIIRDTRVVYVSPADDLKVKVTADREEYLPGKEGVIRFEVTDSAGKPTQAALGVLVVDEAVYALQEMQPGLEKVFFTLQEELLKPQAQVVYKPSEGLDALVRRPVLGEERQQVAKALLTAVRPKPPGHWQVNPALARRQKVEEQVAQVAWALFNHATQKRVLTFDRKAGAWVFRDGVLEELVKAVPLRKEALTDPVGGTLTLEALAKLEKGFTPERLGRALTEYRMQLLLWPVADLANRNRAAWLKGGKWKFPAGAVANTARGRGWKEEAVKDAWGGPIKLVKRPAGDKNNTGSDVFNEHTLASAGPDGKFGTRDDITYRPVNQWEVGQVWWLPEGSRQARHTQLAWRNAHVRGLRGGMDGAVRFGGMAPGMAGGAGGPRAPMAWGGMPPPPMAMPEKAAAKGKDREGKGADKVDSKPVAEGGGAEPTRLREYFPETLLWRPSLVTDERGRAELRIPFADSITTWRLSASASSRAGSLGGVTAPLRVFQDFFCDPDLPVALTQNDEVAFPVAVYNYLKKAQTVTLDLKPEPWFELADGHGYKRTLGLKAGQVTSVKFRIRAKKVGNFPLTVHARGTKMSDAVKRSIDVLPDGVKREQVFTDRLKGAVRHTVTIPDGAIAGASRLFVKVYPGVMSQVLEGTEGMLRLPGG